MASNLAAIWGARIKARRAELGLRQLQFRDQAIALGAPISQQSLSAWENGKSTPREDIKPVIAKILGLHPNDLFSFPEDDENGGAGEAVA